MSMTRFTSLFAAFALAAVVGACKKDDSKAEESANQATPVEAEASGQDKSKLVAKTAMVDKAKMAAPAENAAADVGEMTAEELDELLAAGEVAVLDSNSEKVRKEFGKIPTATLLSHSTDYELSELPEDKAKKLVFYCSNTQCGASKKSAGKALAAGYTDVNILPAGVIGWKEAGKKTEKAL